jgi:DNA-binding MarR family transcriptional regulator
MTEDLVDRILAQWRRARPDLDPSPMGVVFRIKRLARLFERATARSFASHGLEPGEFGALATLRRTGPPHRMSAGRLGHELLLTSGSTTNRIDRLEAAGLIRRLDDPDDRRGVLVELTAVGLRRVEAALERHLAIERELLSALTAPQQEQLVGLLRKLVIALDEPAGGAEPDPAAEPTTARPRRNTVEEARTTRPGRRPGTRRRG